MTWAEKIHPENQQKMIDTYTKLSKESGALLAPIGVVWKEVRNKYPDIELYYKDGEHASPYGDLLISAVMVKAISGCNPSFPDYILDNKLIFDKVITAEENIEKVKIPYDKKIAENIYSCIH